MLIYLLLLVPMPPLLGFLLLALDPYRLDRRAVLAAAITAGATPFFLLAPLVALWSLGLLGDGTAPIFALDFGEYVIDLAMGLDAMSAITGLTVAVIAPLVMYYAIDYMTWVRIADLRRFFSVMNLFMAGMLAMVLAADTIVFFLGWELMGLCSFFLIAYNMTSPRAFAAGRKAFIITRIADAALLAGLLLLFLEAGTVRFDVLIPTGAATEGARGSLIAALLLVGALGKSAQLPFQTWLPTAMAGPTPVSALLHSATMVAAGAVLLARFAPIIAAHEAVAYATAVAGVATALFGAVCAIAQLDVKRLLAYSSISQIGFMVLAVGVGAPAAAVAHFVVHAMFKSLLFLAAGVMANAAGHDTRIDSLTGARRNAPIAFWTYAAGAASLAGLPLMTAGWWSKEAILASAFGAGPFGQGIWVAALLAATLTGVYAFRPVFAAARSAPPDGVTRRRVRERIFYALPLILLAGGALLGGFLVEPILHAMGAEAPHPPHWVEYTGAGAALAGVLGAMIVTYLPPAQNRIRRARKVRAGFQADARYYAAFVRPYRRMVRLLSSGGDRFADRVTRAPDASIGDPVGEAMVAAGLWLRRVVVEAFQPDRIDRGWMRTASGVGTASGRARRLQTGRVRDYAMGLAIGLVVLLILAWGVPWR